MCNKCILLFYFFIQSVALNISDTFKVNLEERLESFSQYCVPPLSGREKGQSGNIAIIGGSSHEASIYFTAISTLKAGADFVEVFTTESSVPIIKSYNPNIFTVLPLLQNKFLPKLRSKLENSDLIIIGPGITRNEDPDLYSLIHDIILFCKDIKKPLVLDAGALHAVSKNLTIIYKYPSPGVILTPNRREADILAKGVRAESNVTNWYDHWGEYVSVLAKGREDKFHSSINALDWRINKGGSSRRGIGQGDILAGILGTFYNWALQSDICANSLSVQYRQSLAAYAAATITRKCNNLAFNKLGRSMLASDMVKEIHTAFDLTIKS